MHNHLYRALRSASRQLQSVAAPEWTFSRSWLRVVGEVLEVETGVLQVCESSQAATAGASSVLALHCSAGAQEQWVELAGALRRQQAEAIAAYDAGDSPTAPIWSTPRAISAPAFFGYGSTSPWPFPLGVGKPQQIQDLVRVMITAAAAAHATREVEEEGLDPTQYINLLRDLGVSTKRLETHFFEGQTTTSLEKALVDEKSALGISMSALSHMSSSRGSVPAIAASAPPRWRLLGQQMGAAVAVQALLSEPKFGGSLDSIVLFEPAAFALLCDPRCQDKNAAREYESFVNSLVSHAKAQNWDDWASVYLKFWSCAQDGHALREKESEQLVATALSTTHDCVANLEAMATASSNSLASTAAVDALAALRCPKHVIVSSDTAGGACAAVAQLLNKHAGFCVHTTPGGHLAPYTHASTVMPLIAKCLLDMTPPAVYP